MRRHRAVPALAVLLTLSVGCKPKPHVERVAPGQLQPGPIRHEELSAQQLERLTRLQQTFAEVDPTPLEKWLDDFKRDEHPDREIAVYEQMAEAYSAFCSRKTWTLEAKNEAYSLLLLRSGAPEEDALRGAKLKALSLADAKELLRLYTAKPAPIVVAPN